MAEVSGAPVLGTFAMFDKEWQVFKVPPSLMVARLARIDESDPEAVGVLDQVIEHALGREQHRRFLACYYDAAPADGNDAEMFQRALAGILEAGTGRPTS